jgi:hypothetical protein
MLTKLFEVIFGCSHGHYGFPRKTRSGCSGACFLTGTYVVCLDCGKELAYDWNEMKVIDSPSQERHYLRSAVSKQVA